MSDLRSFIKISSVRMRHHYHPKLIKCLNALSTEEIWRIEPPLDHSIGGLVNHIISHIERNILRINNPGLSFEKGIENSFEQLEIDREAFIESISDVFTRLDQSLKRGTIEMYDLYHLVEHTGYHLGQIVDRTKRMKGLIFNFAAEGINERALLEQL